MRYVLLVLALVVAVAAPAMAQPFPNLYADNCPDHSVQCR